MKIVKYSGLVHLGEIHSQARVSSPYELVQNSFRHTFNYLLHCIIIIIIIIIIISSSSSSITYWIMFRLETFECVSQSKSL